MDKGETSTNRPKNKEIDDDAQQDVTWTESMCQELKEEVWQAMRIV